MECTKTRIQVTSWYDTCLYKLDHSTPHSNDEAASQSNFRQKGGKKKKDEEKERKREYCHKIVKKSMSFS